MKSHLKIVSYILSFVIGGYPLVSLGQTNCFADQGTTLHITNQTSKTLYLESVQVTNGYFADGWSPPATISPTQDENKYQALLLNKTDNVCAKANLVYGPTPVPSTDSPSCGITLNLQPEDQYQATADTLSDPSNTACTITKNGINPVFNIIEK